MPQRPTLPSDDLYAMLELPTDATPEAIEIAWRALLRQHHPDVAGPAGLERAKRINVAHDWLSDAQLRLRYDRERGLRGGSRARRGSTWRDPREDGGTPNAHQARHRPSRGEDPVRRFLERVSSLSPDELDRLAMADPAPIAFGATIRRFLAADRRVALETVEAEIGRRLPPGATAQPRVLDAVGAYAAELVLGSFLDELLSEPFRARSRERLSRGWEAAVGQPRYGPNGPAVRALIGRLGRLDAAEVVALAKHGALGHLGEAPWPPGTSPDDDEALRVSSALAARDAVAAVAGAVGGSGLARTVVARAERAAGRVAHLLVLRHAFPPATFAALTAPWRPGLVPDDPRGPSVGRPTRG